MGVDAREQVMALHDVPLCDPGAPLPVVVAGDLSLYLVYVISDSDARWNERIDVAYADETFAERWALLRFHRPVMHLFGMPNDEALHGHPLFSRGLRSYQAHEVVFSSWIRTLEHMNSVHPQHDPAEYMRLHHYIYTFHDTLFECVARAYELVAVQKAPLSRLMARIAQGF